MKTGLLLLGAIFLTSLGANGAEVFELGKANFSERPQGKEADSIAGDFVLRTDKISAAISGDLPLRRANMSAFYGDGNHTPGCLYDLTLRGQAKDQLTIFSPGARKGEVTHVIPVENDDPKSAAVEVYISAATSNSDVDETHTYEVRDDWDGILITSRYKNHGEKTVKKNIYDHWTQMREQGSIKGIRWANAIDPAHKTGYAFAWVEKKGSKFPDEQIVERASRRLLVEVEPGETFQCSRFLVVATSPAKAIGLVAKVRNPISVTNLDWSISCNDGTALDRAGLVFRQKGNYSPTAYPDENGRIELPWFIGGHQVEIEDTGRETVKEDISLELRKTFQKRTTLSDQSRVKFSITSGGGDTPCKIQFTPQRGTAKPNLGPTDRAHGCRDQWHSETGSVEVPLPAGDYRIAVTRGPEFSRITQSISLKPGEVVEVKGELNRVIDSIGWVSTDFHNHSTPSGDNTCGTDDRIINLVAENIEFAPTTEHNRLYDWESNIEALKLTPFIKTVPGMELTGRGAHLNCFPLTPEPTKQDGGAPVWNSDPRISALLLSNWQKVHPDRWVHLNHPNMSENFIDRNKDGKADGGFLYVGKFLNGLETQNYKDSKILETAPFSVGPARTGLGKQVNVYREFIWLQLLNQGLGVWAVGVADAHHVYGNGVGSWRTYVPSSTDQPAEIKWEEISRNARKGQMVLSSGPYLEVQTEKGTIAGGSETVLNKKVDLKVKVQCADWIDIDRVQVLVNSRQVPDYNYTIASHPKLFKQGIVRFEETISIALKEDSHLIVVVMGEKADMSALYGSSTQSSMKPCAYNNPIYIDTDGDGFQPNGDTLGFDLPVGGVGVKKVESLLKGKP